MRIELANLEDSKGAFDHVYASGELDLNDERVRLKKPARVAGRIRREGSKLKISGTIHTEVEVDCDRCLQKVELPMATEFGLEYVTVDEYNLLHAAELSEEDLNLSVFDGETIDVDEIVREQLLLGVPSQVFCRETCKGLCPECGANRNLTECSCEQEAVDPRWAALKELK
jgi:uncharacterized protein